MIDSQGQGFERVLINWADVNPDSSTPCAREPERVPRRWSDGEPDSWEDEENVSSALVEAWLRDNGQQSVQLNPQRGQQQRRKSMKKERKPRALGASGAADPVLAA